MKLEGQVCSVELAKKLKELGVKQKSLFYYSKSCEGHSLIFLYNDINEELRNYSAFTVAELGKMLPYRRYNALACHKVEKYMWEVSYNGIHEANKALRAHKDKSEANARAKMLIYMLEQRCISDEELNG